MNDKQKVDNLESLRKRVMHADREALIYFLTAEREEVLSTLWEWSDQVRRQHVGDAVHLRGLIEVSNYCAANCIYCGIRAGNHHLLRYRMEIPEILTQVRLAVKLGYGTVVLQSGESSRQMPGRWVTELIRTIRSECDLAITLGMGERSRDEYQEWFSAGANRYLMRYETSNSGLFHTLHPGHLGLESRLNSLHLLREIGYEIGSGIMVGIPGQTWDDLAADLLLFRQLNLDMIGVGPFLPHPETPLGSSYLEGQVFTPGAQVPNNEITTLKTVALTRLVCPMANIPSTTALAAVDVKSGHELGLSRGANVIMPNLTPTHYRSLYEIYPAKADTGEAAEHYDSRLKARILALGRHPGIGRGDSPNKGVRTCEHNPEH